MTPQIGSTTYDMTFLQQLSGKTAIVTGGSNGIGAQTVKSFSRYGSNVVIADLESTARDAEVLIASLSNPAKALYVPTNILIWDEMKILFRYTIEHFGRVDVVVANAGIMESRSVFDLGAVDDQGELQESLEGFRVLDVNLKGTLNSKPSIHIRHHMLVRNTTDYQLLDSNKTGIIPYAKERTLFPGFLSRLHCFSNLNLGILWQQRGRGLCCLETRPCWTSPVISTGMQSNQREVECGGAIFHPNPDLLKAFGRMGSLRSQGKYTGRRRKCNCTNMSCSWKWEMCYGEFHPV